MKAGAKCSNGEKWYNNRNNNFRNLINMLFRRSPLLFLSYHNLNTFTKTLNSLWKLLKTTYANVEVNFDFKCEKVPSFIRFEDWWRLQFQPINLNNFAKLSQ